MPGGVAGQPIRPQSNAAGPIHGRGKIAPICMQGPVAATVISGRARNSVHAAAELLAALQPWYRKLQKTRKLGRLDFFVERQPIGRGQE